MALTEINWSPSRRELRIFAGALACLFAAIAFFSWQGSGSNRGPAILVVLSLFLLAAGGVKPDWIRPVYLLWMILFYPIRWLVSCLLIGLVYYLVISPTGLILRLFGSDLVGKRFDLQSETYWNSRRGARNEKEYFRQF